MDDHKHGLKYKQMSHVTDQYSSSSISSSIKRRVWVAGPIIVGAGPSGLAVAACLKERGIPRLILERSDCIASLWKYKTYDRLRLHLPKQFCQLPLFPFPPDFPTYPTKQDFIAYLESYAAHFNLSPLFNRTVVGAKFVDGRGFWSVKVAAAKKKAARGGGNRATGSGVGVHEGGEEALVVVEYVCPWLIVATGENAEAVVPDIDGLNDFVGDVVHTSCFRSGVEFMGKRVLVVGCGNSGMEVCLDLCNHNALPSLVVRDSVHVLPQEMIGTSTFGLAMCLLKWFPVRLVDKFLLLMSRLMIGDTDRIGLSRPSIGPLEWKNISGKTPVLDIGTLDKIKAGIIKVFPEIKKITSHGAEFTDGKLEDFDAIIFATGYRSNVSNWLKDNKMFSERDGFPVKSFPDGWKGEDGLYAVGFTKHGLLGASLDAVRIAEDIEQTWKIRARRHTGCAGARFCQIHQK